MNPNTKTHCWSAAAGLATYALGLIAAYYYIHPATSKQILIVMVFPLCPAVFVSTGIKLKLMRPYQRKYFWRMLFGMTAYIFGIKLVNDLSQNQHHKYWLVVFPLLPLIYVVVTTIRAVAGMDEMKRKIATEACAFSGLATGFTCFTYLFLRDMGAPEFHAEWAFYLMVAYYWIGAFFSWRRYW
jgi:hypothetical protein